MKDGRAAITMHLERLTDSDAIKSAAVLQSWLDDTRPTLAKGVDIHVYQEIWILLKHQLTMIFENGFTGLILVVLTLFLFLSGRVGWWVMVGFPVT